MQFLKANTEVIVTVGPFVDKDDGLTPQVDITLGGNEAELVKHGSTSVVDISGATWAAVTNCRGYYSLTLTTAHTDTEGLLIVIVQDDSDCLPVKQEYMVLSEAAWDSMFAAKDTGYMNVNANTTVPDAAGTAAGLHTTTDAAIAALNNFDPVNDAVASVTAVGTCTTNTDMVGTDNAATAAKLEAYVQLLARSDAAITTDRATELAEINANEGSGVGDYAATTDSQEAIRDVAPHGSTMVGTNGATLAATWTDAKAGYLDAAVTSRLAPTTASRTLDVAATGEAGLDFDNIKDATGAHTLTNITVPTATDVTSRVTADMTYIHGTALTETAGQLAGRFTDFFDQASATFSVATALSSFMATVLDAAGVRGAVGLASANLDTQLADIPTVAEFNARTLAAADYFVHGSDTVTVGTNNDKTGYTLTNLSDANAGKLEDILDGTGGTGLTLNSLVISGSAAGGVVNIDNSGGPGAMITGSTYGLDLEATGADSIGLRCRADAGAGMYVTGGVYDFLGDIQGTVSGNSTHDAAAVKTAVEADGSKLDHLWETTEDDAGVRRFTTNALEQAPTDSGLSAQQARDAMKLAPTAGAPAAGSVDKHLDDASTHDAAAVVTALGTGTTLTAVPWNSSWDVEVQSECADALTAYDPPTNAEMEARTLGATPLANLTAQYDGTRRVLYVATAANGGDDANDGSGWGKAKLTIGAAVGAASNGDRIVVGPGSFGEAVNLSSLTGIVLELLSGATVTQSSGVTVTLGTDCILEGEGTITQTGTSASYAVRGSSKDGTRVEGLQISSNCKGVSFVGGSRGVVENNRISGKEYGVLLTNCDCARVENNQIVCAGWTACNSSPLYVTGSTTCLCSNNTLIVTVTDGDSTHRAIGIQGSGTARLTAINNHVDATVSSGSHAHGVWIQSGDVEVVIIGGSYRASAPSESYDLYAYTGKIYAKTKYVTSSVGTGTITDLDERAVQNVLVDNNLDHLMKTAVGDNADMTTEVADGTALSNLMTKGSDTSDFTVADDSLEGQAEVLAVAAADVVNLDGAAMRGTDGAAVAGDAMALTSSERDAVATALLDLASSIDGKTPREALQYIASVVAGEMSGARTGTETFVGLDGTTERLKATVDTSGNRSAVEYDP